MTPEQTRILALAQSIALARAGRYRDVEDDELDEFLAQTVDWTNQFIQELEMEADWNYVRENNYGIDISLVEGSSTFFLPIEVQRLVISPDRDLSILQDGSVISTFRLVSPNQISNPSDHYSGDRATLIGRNLVLSRPITESEVGGTLRADVVLYIPRLAMDNVEMLDLVEPQQLIVLGVAKNWSLPDIVQGGVSPSLTQKYADLLNKSVAKNNETAQAYEASGEDYSYIGGVW